DGSRERLDTFHRPRVPLGELASIAEPIASERVTAATLIEVGAGAEGASRSGDDDGPDVVIGLAHVEEVGELRGHLPRPRVHPVRTIELGDRDSSVPLDKDLLVADLCL